MIILFNLVCTISFNYLIFLIIFFHPLQSFSLFDFDPRIVHTPVMIFEAATDETLVFLILMLLYYKVSIGIRF